MSVWTLREQVDWSLFWLAILLAADTLFSYVAITTGHATEANPLISTPEQLLALGTAKMGLVALFYACSRHDPWLPASLWFARGTFFLMAAVAGWNLGGAIWAGLMN